MAGRIGSRMAVATLQTRQTSTRGEPSTNVVAAHSQSAPSPTLCAESDGCKASRIQLHHRRSERTQDNPQPVARRAGTPRTDGGHSVQTHRANPGRSRRSEERVAEGERAV